MAPVEEQRSRHVVIGVDTHKDIHVAAVMDTLAGSIGTLTIPTNTRGFTALEAWANAHGKVIAVGIEGTGSYGATLTSFLRRAGFKVLEAGRPDRRMRRMNGKSDTLDAENAAQSILAGLATTTPKTADGAVEMIRVLKITHDTAVTHRTAAMITLKNLLVHTSDEMRATSGRMTPIKLARHLAALRPRGLDTVEDASRHALRSLARRWLTLDTEAKDLNAQVATLVSARAPQLLDRFGVGIDTAAEILIVAGDNPEQIRSEAAFAKLAGISPVPTGSGKTSGRHRVNHGGHRQLNAAIYRTVIVRMQFHEPTRAYVERRTTEGLSKREIIRCLKRYVIREVYHDIKSRPPVPATAS